MSRYSELKKVIKRLRKDCPWDRKQTRRSLIPYLKEETGEFIESAKKGDFKEMEEELGDILLNVFFQAEIASEKKKFDIDGVFDGIIAKMKRRHPHVFGKTKVSSVKEIISNWKKIKASEKKKQL